MAIFDDIFEDRSLDGYGEGEAVRFPSACASGDKGMDSLTSRKKNAACFKTIKSLAWKFLPVKAFSVSSQSSFSHADDPIL